jgi:ring-1,2-phenylacetyl-CoA epoxidase subunit PaaE
VAAAIPRFHSLTVAEVRPETSDAVSIAFAVPPALAADYAFAPGQYLTLRRTLDGEDMRRSYSICAGPADKELRIAVKRVPGGPFSTWATTELRAGEAVDVMTPTGRFGTHAGQGHVYAGFAAGSGITPILSILRGILARRDASRFFLFYGNRTSNDMLFREALEELKDRHLGRLSVFHVLSQEQQDVPVLTGRLDPDRVRLLLTHIVPAATLDHAFVCGPEGMSEGVAATLRDLGLPDDRIHIERFVSALSGRPAARRPVTPAAAGQAPHCIATVILDGKRTDVPVADGEAVLDAARGPRSALCLQGRHVLHLPRPAGRGAGDDGAELLPRKMGDGCRLRAHLPVAPDDAARGAGLRPGLIGPSPQAASTSRSMVAPISRLTIARS